MIIIISDAKYGFRIAGLNRKHGQGAFCVANNLNLSIQCHSRKKRVTWNDVPNPPPPVTIKRKLKNRSIREVLLKKPKQMS